MKQFIIIPALFLLAGCSGPVADSQPVKEAREYLGYHEQTNREELTDVLGVDPVYTEWCAAFVNAMLKEDGSPNLNDINHPYPLLARSFLEYGSPINPQDIQYGDLVIFPRGNQGWQGHVGFYVGRYSTGEWIILGGNQNQTVSYALFESRRVIGIRRIST